MVGACLVVFLAACGRGITVRTVVAPDAGLQALRTFRMLPPPKPRADRSIAGDEPMLVNSISNQALREEIRRAFVQRGYRETDDAPDFVVAFYASAREKLDVTAWDYGYPYAPRWWRGVGRPRPIVTMYHEGTVIIDVLAAASRDLLWRGEGVSAVPDDEAAYIRDLGRTVDAILERFPAGSAPP